MSEHSPEKSVPSETGEISNVGNNAKSTTYKLGGITGKGFLPGQSGNPSGRPKGSPVTDMLRRLFEEQPETIYSTMLGVFTGKSAVAKVMLLEKAAERLEGKVVQPVEGDINLNLGISDRLQRAKSRVDGSEPDTES